MVQFIIEPFIKLVNMCIYMQININSLIIRRCLVKEFIDHISMFQKEDAQ